MTNLEWEKYVSKVARTVTTVNISSLNDSILSPEWKTEAKSRQKRPKKTTQVKINTIKTEPKVVKYKSVLYKYKGKIYNRKVIL
jgi:hypothetical protein